MNSYNLLVIYLFDATIQRYLRAKGDQLYDF